MSCIEKVCDSRPYLVDRLLLGHLALVGHEQDTLDLEELLVIRKFESCR